LTTQSIGVVRRMSRAPSTVVAVCTATSGSASASAVATRVGGGDGGWRYRA